MADPVAELVLAVPVTVTVIFARLVMIVGTREEEIVEVALMVIATAHMSLKALTA